MSVIRDGIKTCMRCGHSREEHGKECKSKRQNGNNCHCVKFVTFEYTGHYKDKE